MLLSNMSDVYVVKSACNMCSNYAKCVKMGHFVAFVTIFTILGHVKRVWVPIQPWKLIKYAI